MAAGDYPLADSFILPKSEFIQTYNHAFLGTKLEE
jgi:hypothetical protein